MTDLTTHSETQQQQLASLADKKRQLRELVDQMGQANWYEAAKLASKVSLLAKQIKRDQEAMTAANR